MEQKKTPKVAKPVIRLDIQKGSIKNIVVSDSSSTSYGCPPAPII